VAPVPRLDATKGVDHPDVRTLSPEVWQWASPDDGHGIWGYPPPDRRVPGQLWLQVRLHVREVARQAVGAKAHHYYGSVRPCIPNAMRAVQALAIAPKGFTPPSSPTRSTPLTSLTEADYTTRQAAYDLRKLPAKALITKPGRSRRYVVPPAGARTISALLTLRDQVIAPLLAGMRSPCLGHPHSILSPADRHHEKLRIDTEALFTEIGDHRRRLDNLLPIADRQAPNSPTGWPWTIEAACPRPLRDRKRNNCASLPLTSRIGLSPQGSAFGSPNDVRERWRRDFPKAEVIEIASHYIQEDAAEEIVLSIKRRFACG
jgi:hypothetical protein